MAIPGVKKKNSTPSAGGNNARVKVIGVGGGGGNAVSRMAQDFVRGVDFIAINTDAQDLEYCSARHKLYVGKNLTRGLGTGMNPELGAQAAEENRSDIAELVKGADLIFITAGMGGGTGTGASPIVADVARQSGALTIGVVTKPFLFEGAQRSRVAEEGIQKLREKVDALIVVPNDKIFTVIDKDTPIMKAFEKIDEVLRNAVQGIVELVTAPGIINVDFADVQTVMQNSGTAIIGLGIASGPDRAVKAITQAINFPLLDVNAEGAKGILLSVSGNRDLRMTEVNQAARLIVEMVDPNAKIIFGAYHDRKLKSGQIKVTLIATGFTGTKPNGNGSSSLFGAEEKPAKSFLDSPLGDLGSAIDMKPLETPAVRTVGAKEKQPLKKESEKQEDKWDIPAFLRRRKK
ncbi:MAG: cell division protein FtsZ [Candidatus Liptonbacteria bacterium]|nr:cell division protein FtsZ [Candidatus Liptonbacteria bacterium]